MKKRLIGDLEARIEEDMGGGNYGRGRGRGDADDMDLGGFDPPVWQNYEQMDDIEKSSLLERAIMVLAEDRSEGGKAPVDNGLRNSRMGVGIGRGMKNR